MDWIELNRLFLLTKFICSEIIKKNTVDTCFVEFYLWRSTSSKNANNNLSSCPKSFFSLNIISLSCHFFFLEIIMFSIPKIGPSSKPRVLMGNWYEEHLATEVGDT